MKRRDHFLAALIIAAFTVGNTTAQESRSAEDSPRQQRREAAGGRKGKQTEPSALKRTAPIKVGQLPTIDILQRLGAKLESGTANHELSSYLNAFDRTDPNRDGMHTREEYVEQGRYMTPQARAGIFRAADGNSDGVVSRAEYVLNRIITDEAKAIVQEMDDDQDGLVEKVEFIRHSTELLSDAILAGQVFSALDANGDGGIPTPEYLRVWGQWARAGQKSAEKRIASRQAELAKSSKKPGSKTAQTPAGSPGGRPPFGRPGGGPPSGRPAGGTGPPGVDSVFERFDGNRDGKLQKTEIPTFVQQFILPADANGDDVVTKKELQAYRQRPRPAGRPAGGNPEQ